MQFTLRFKYFCLFIILLCSFVLIGARSISTSTPVSCDVPSQDYVRTNGYPTNQSGETYGPDIKESTHSPDLILVQSGNVLGYVKASDLDDGVTSLDDARYSNPVMKAIPIYLHDGKTVVGEFFIGG